MIERPIKISTRWILAVDEILEKHGCPTTGVCDAYALEDEIRAYGDEMWEHGYEQAVEDDWAAQKAMSKVKP